MYSLVCGTRTCGGRSPSMSSGSSSGSSASSSCTSTTTTSTAREHHPHGASRLMVMRHSERVDELFPDWIQRCGRVMQQGGQYKPYDMNMPHQLPLDRDISLFRYDTPITRMGEKLAELVGQSIETHSWVPDVIYCSPAIRSLQTATAVRNILGVKTLIRMEPGVFENCSLYPNGVPKVTSAREAAANGFPVDEQYIRKYDFDRMFSCPEDIYQYNRRIQTTLNRITNEHEYRNDGEQMTYLVVAHASTVDMAVGLLRARPRPSEVDHLRNIGARVPFCGIVPLIREKPTQNVWSIAGSLLPVTWSGYSNELDWDFVQRQE